MLDISDPLWLREEYGVSLHFPNESDSEGERGYCVRYYW